ncbi:ComEA family DNA-binding protein [Pigmentiphaga litoralis]|uniref:ComEA family DNA-binding protein n=1 Tax=Pigmentiphaga litoralis TaxID=516702 RepID=UPI003B43B009
MNPFLESACARPSADPGTAPPSAGAGAAETALCGLSAEELAVGQWSAPSPELPEVRPAQEAMATVAVPTRRARAVRRRTHHFVFLAALTAGGMSLGTPGAAYGLDVNTATEPQLEGIRGIGPKTAALIVKERQQRGQFSSFEEFAGRVRGIGPKRAERLAAQGLTVGTAARVLPAGSPAKTHQRNMTPVPPARTSAFPPAPDPSRMPPALIVNTPDASKGKGH